VAGLGGRRELRSLLHLRPAVAGLGGRRGL